MSALRRLAPVVIVAVLLVPLHAACGGASGPPEVSEARKNIAEAYSGGPDLKILAISLLVDHPDLPTARARTADAFASTSLQEKLQAFDIADIWGPEAFIDPLTKLLEDPSEIVRLGAAERLARAGDSRGTALLEPAIRDNEGGLMPRRCAALAAAGVPVCVGQAVRDLSSKSEPSLAAATATLAEIGGDEARTALRAALKKLRDGRRAYAIEALGVVGDESDVKRVLPYIRYRANLLAVVRALGALGGEKAVSTLKEYAEKDDPVVRLEASGALLRAGGADAATVERLAEAAGEEREDLRYLAVRLLTPAVGEAGVVDALVRFAGDDDGRVRREALSALVGHAPPESVLLLEQAYIAGSGTMDGADYEAAQRALVAAARLGTGESRALLTRVMRESDNWAHILQASYGLLAGYDEAPARDPA